MRQNRRSESILNQTVSEDSRILFEVIVEGIDEEHRTVKLRSHPQRKLVLSENAVAAK